MAVKKYGKYGKKGSTRYNKRKAYRKNNKQRFVNARQPVVETKISSSHLANHNIDLGWNVHIPLCYKEMTQGFEASQMVGRSIFSKYLNTRFALNFDGGLQIPSDLDLRIVAGWCKLPQNIPMRSNTATTPTTPEVVYGFTPEDHIKQYLKNTFVDLLSVNDKEKFKLFMNKIYHGTPRTIHLDTSDFTDQAGSHPNEVSYVNQYIRRPQIYSVKWKPMRKLHCEPVTDTEYPSQPPATNMDFFSPCNKSKQWIPFIAIDLGNTTSWAAVDSRPQLEVRSKHYFTDS